MIDAKNTIFIYNFMLMFVEALVLLYLGQGARSEKQNDRRKKLFIVLVAAQWILISGLRAAWVGSDTINYLNNFKKHCKLPWETVFTNFYKFYIEGDESQFFEPGFVLFERVVGIFSNDLIWYQFAIALVFMPLFGKFLYKNSDDPFLSFLVYSGFMYFMFSLTGYRQVISCAIGIFIGYEFIKKRNFWMFLFVIAIAYTVHKSIITFFPFYFLANKKITQRYLTVVIIMAIVLLVFRNQAFGLLKSVVGYDEYAQIDAGAPVNFTILLAILVTAALIQRKFIIYRDESPVVTHCYNGILMMCMTIFAAFVNPTAMRVVYNYGFFLLLFVPKLAQSFSKQNDKFMVYSIIIAVFAFFIITNAKPYQFYWEYGGYRY